MSRVDDAWRRIENPGDTTVASPSNDGTPTAASPSVDAVSLNDAAQPATALFPLRESGASAEGAAVLDAADSRSARLPDAQSRRNQTFEELIRAIARDEERMNLTGRAASPGVSLPSRS